MISLLDKKECNGCCACLDICPVGAIRLVTDSEGFWYPEIDRKKCNDCSLCDNICPETQSKSPILQVGEEPVCYAARHKDIEVIKDSTSGGVFSAFADAVFTEGGSVAGAVYREDFSVQHIVSNDPKDLLRLRSSKYLQSNCEGLYTEIKRLLRAGKKVLVCGSPCQMAALRLFLDKDYESLIICDFICRGVNSPKVFRKHLDALEEKFGSKLVYAKAKNKEHGWRSLTFKAVFENGQSYYGNGQEDDFTRGYLQRGSYCRPSCFDCKFKEMPRIADITVGDFWGVENAAPSLDDNLGTSLVMCNTPKGKAFFESVKESLQNQEVTLKDIESGNRHLYESINVSQEGRETFFSDLETMSFPQVAAKHFPKRAGWVNSLKIKKILKGIRILFWAMGFSPRAWTQFFWLNFLRRNTTSDLLKMHLLFPSRHSVFDIHKSAKIVIKGTVRFGFSQIRGSRLETRMRMDKGAELHFNDGFGFSSGADIQIFPGGVLTFEGGQASGCNIHCQIVCADRIRIGRGTLIGRNVVLRDYDAHYIIQKGYKIKAPITIGDHCWIGEGALIGKGVTIGNGSIVAARSWVISKVTEKTLVGGSPAMPINKNIEWRL